MGLDSVTPIELQQSFGTTAESSKQDDIDAVAVAAVTSINCCDGDSCCALLCQLLDPLPLHACMHACELMTLVISFDDVDVVSMSVAGSQSLGLHCAKSHMPFELFANENCELWNEAKMNVTF